MTKKVSWLGMLVLMPLIGMTVVGYINAQENGLNGTWIWTRINEPEETSSADFTYNNGSFEMSFSNDPYLKGSYSIDDKRIVFETIYLHGNLFYKFDSYNDVTISKIRIELKWYSKNDLKIIGVYSDEEINNLFQPLSAANYSLNGNTLTLNYDDGDISIYTRNN